MPLRVILLLLLPFHLFSRTNFPVAKLNPHHYATYWGLGTTFTKGGTGIGFSSGWGFICETPNANKLTHFVATYSTSMEIRNFDELFMQNSLMVSAYWKYYQYGPFDATPYEFLDAGLCVENNFLSPLQLRVGPQVQSTFLITKHHGMPSRFSIEGEAGLLVGLSGAPGITPKVSATLRYRLQKFPLGY